MTGLCQYRDIFGEVNTGAHSYRFFGLAAVDLVLTVIGTGLIAKTFKWSFWKTFIALMIIAIILHRLFCVNTTINVLLFGTI